MRFRVLVLVFGGGGKLVERRCAGNETFISTLHDALGFPSLDSIWRCRSIKDGLLGVVVSEAYKDSAETIHSNVICVDCLYMHTPATQ